MRGDVGWQAAFVDPGVAGAFPEGRPGGRPRREWRAVSVRRELVVVVAGQPMALGALPLASRVVGDLGKRATRWVWKMSSRCRRIWCRW